MNLNQVTITSSNLKKSSVFYKKLGLKLIVDALPRYRLVIMYAYILK